MEATFSVEGQAGGTLDLWTVTFLSRKPAPCGEASHNPDVLDAPSPVARDCSVSKARSRGSASWAIMTGVVSSSTTAGASFLH